VGAQKRKTAVFQIKSPHFAWRKSATKFLSVKTVSDKVIGVSISAKMIGGGRPLLHENLADTDPPLAKRRFSIYFQPMN